LTSIETLVEAGRREIEIRVHHCVTHCEMAYFGRHRLECLDLLSPGAEVRLRRVPDLVASDVMAKVPGWEERSKRMLAEYGAPTHADVEWADGIIFGTPTRFGTLQQRRT
jgi:hypothetical protein